MAATKVSRPRSPTVAEELADVYLSRTIPAPEALERAALRRATVVSSSHASPHTYAGVRYTFEDGSCIEFMHDEILIDPNCQE